MNIFTIRDIENLSGIKAHTLRIWEQRYNLMTPKRKESNHRYYDNEDLKHILRISHLYHNGYKISKIAAMETSTIKGLLTGIQNSHSYPLYVNQLFEAAIDFDDDKFEHILEQAITKRDFSDVMIQVIYPFLQKIGLLWVTEHVIPSQEHFSSNLIIRKILIETDALKDVAYGNQDPVLLFTPENENHEIPLLFIQYLLKKNGKRIIYFGSNIPIEILTEYCSVKKISRLHFHLITHLKIETVDEYVARLAGNFPNTPIVMSGPCVAQVNSKPVNVRLLFSQNEILEYVKE